MATLLPGTGVRIHDAVLERLAYPPDDRAELLIGVHPAALNAPGSPATQVVGFLQGDLEWAGALSERHLDVTSVAGGDPRQMIGDRLGVGGRLWEVVRPGELLADPRRGPLDTVYRGDRPWVVVGEVSTGDLLAAPLNDATNPKWFTPLLGREDIRMAGSVKDTQLELAHLWSFPGSVAATGEVAEGARARVLGALRHYF